MGATDTFSDILGRRGEHETDFTRYLHRVATPRAPEGLFEAIVEGLVQDFGATAAYAYIADEERQRLWLRAYRRIGGTGGTRCDAPREWVGFDEPHAAALSVSSRCSLLVGTPRAQPFAADERVAFATPLVAKGRLVAAIACMFNTTLDTIRWKELRSLSKPLGALVRLHVPGLESTPAPRPEPVVDEPHGPAPDHVCDASPPETAAPTAVSKPKELLSGARIRELLRRRDPRAGAGRGQPSAPTTVV